MTDFLTQNAMGINSIIVYIDLGIPKAAIKYIKANLKVILFLYREINHKNNIYIGTDPILQHTPLTRAVCHFSEACNKISPNESLKSFT